MSPEIAQFFPLFIVAPLLIGMAISDLKNLRISNRLVVAMLLVFLLSAPFVMSLPELGYRLAAGAVVFVLGVVGFMCRVWGGGDVKAFAALTLFIPSVYLSAFAFAFSFSLAAGMAVILTGRKAFGTPDNTWSSMRPGAEFPMGVSIALSGLCLPLILIGFPS